MDWIVDESLLPEPKRRISLDGAVEFRNTSAALQRAAMKHRCCR